MKMKRLLLAIAKWIYRYAVFFLLVAFITTCCVSLFLSIFSQTPGVDFTEENLNLAAKMTFVNVVLLSAVFAAIDTLRRKLTVERPARRIINAGEKLMQGDFSVRIEESVLLGTDRVFGEISACFNKMAEELGGVETLRTDFIANVSHEMKTPLAVLQNYGTLLQAPAISDEKRMEYAKGITDASRRMSAMMTNILKLNRLENQQIFPNSSEFDLSEQLCRCFLQYENTWEQREIEPEVDITEGVKISADAELLELVWNNLFSNAFKFTPNGGTVSVSLAADENFAVVTVGDTGCGMSPEVGAHIFEKFYQGDTSRAAQGNGLGLALVKRVVDIMQGEINVESTVGVGSVFTVRIRRA